ncbi:CDP-alcohol phosphatidyltransferase family protein [Caulobacter sp. UNC279MFTsu5.1]|uniref:CDP-alcohol phosphatidyltransferase family protein n=1 Tax=Caulobacter sp. UNC279MFTsu5.1 TaxID=1502775 RepID=UPI0008EE1208|nr:CDP-alcohol phosphatidyltransferase family protein [Caulobacter sp. UNC279MFTsu5.1]SFK43201.1 CDP-diacylglycerol--glycerol-3-phosphate 3-phosphatidyltransferase [Caulobacter sp. UNC279MFTsu5.1]
MVANLVTLVRILLLPVLGAAILTGHGWTALALFLAAGATDILDGQLARRLGQTSAFGAMLDLLADRLLTLVSLGALIATGAFAGVWVVAPLVLVARNFAVAGLQQALPKGDFDVAAVEYPKIALNFLGVSLLLAPVGATNAGLWAVAASAALSGASVAVYVHRALPAFRD